MAGADTPHTGLGQTPHTGLGQTDRTVTGLGQTDRTQGRQDQPYGTVTGRPYSAGTGKGEQRTLCQDCQCLSHVIAARVAHSAH